MKYIVTFPRGSIMDEKLLRIGGKTKLVSSINTVCVVYSAIKRRVLGSVRILTNVDIPAKIIQTIEDSI